MTAAASPSADDDGAAHREKFGRYLAVYDGVDDELVWRALEKRVPRMIAQLVGDEGQSLH